MRPFTRYKLFNFLAPPTGEMQFILSVMFKNPLPNICLKFCVDLMKNLFLRANLVLTYILEKSSLAAKSLVLASVRDPYKIFICIGLKIIPHKVSWNFIKISRASCKETDLAKIQNGGIFPYAKGRGLY